jgi:aromatic-L-amino-acid/L-tryptophan decarboxylase
MESERKIEQTAPINMSPEEFREIGRSVVNKIADLMESLPERKVTSGEPPSKIKELLKEISVPENGTNAKQLFDEVTSLLFNHSLFTGHPKYWGYITSSSSPIGALSEMIAATLNPNVAAWALSPVASEMEKQTIQWIAEMIGYPNDCGGILVSGGNMANYHCYLTARQTKADLNFTNEGVASNNSKKLLVYASTETHLWLHKAAALFGNGTDSIRWIEVDSDLKINTKELKEQIKQDVENGFKPFMVVGTGGSVGTGAVDPLPEIYKICQEFDLWFHVDGAYGAFAAMLHDAPKDLYSLKHADSIALDPHKWLYAPIEAGCVLVRDKQLLKNTFSFHPSYYKFDEVAGEKVESFFDFGMQNSRGFRALKVWMGIKQVGKSGYQQMISDDINLAKQLYRLAAEHSELEVISTNLSITTFRYVPNDNKSEEYLNEINTKLLTQLQEGGEAFVSNAFINGKYVLRACFVNFRSTIKDVKELVEIIVRLGRSLN